MSLPAIGFEFEVLAGWYSISWLDNAMIEAGNRTVYIDGNATERRSFMLSDITLPIDPDYEIEVMGDEESYDLTTSQGWIDMLAAMYDNKYFKVALLCSGIFSILFAVYTRNKAAAAKKAQEGDGGV